MSSLTSRAPGWRVLLSSAVLGAGLLSSCGSSGGNGGNGNCTVSAVAVAASPTSIATSASSTVTATVTASGSSCSRGVSWTASPSGGTLTPSGLTATFTAGTAGAYTITATSTDDPSKSGSAGVTVAAAVACGTPNGTVVTHSANISADETWAGSGVTHQVPNNIQISGSATVTVQSCALVALGAGASITVTGNAKLIAAGTSSTSFVVFERANVNQAWGILRGASATSLIELHWTVLKGGGAFGGQYDNPAIAVAGPGYGVTPVPVLKVDNVYIQAPQGAGIYLDASAGFTADSQNLTISGAGSYAIRTTMMSLGSIPTGSYTGNAIDQFTIIGPNANVFGDLTIHDRGVPVRIQTAGFTVAASGGSTATVTLTLEPGVILLFPKANATTPGARVIFGTNGNSPHNLVGVLNAVGTAAKPIILTSGEANPAPGDWVGIWLDTATGSKLQYVGIDYAGADSSISSVNCRPVSTRDNAALIVGDFEAQYVPPADLITNSEIAYSAGFGIDAVWPAGTYNAPDLTSGNNVHNNAGCAQTYNALTPPATCPTHGCTAN
jgi:hypothetical protein